MARLSQHIGQHATTLKTPSTQSRRESKTLLETSFEDQIASLLSEQFDARSLKTRVSDAVRGGPEVTRSLLQALTQAEGALAEQAIGVFAQSNPDLIVLRDPISLPVTEAALELVDLNEPEALRCVAVSSNRRARRDYRPDLLIVDRKTGRATLIEVKRSLAAYDSARVDAMTRTMLAASMSLPELSFKELRRLSITNVDIALVVADNSKSNIERGVWPSDRIDELIGVAGAGKALGKVRALARARIEAAWRDVLREMRAPLLSEPPAQAGDPVSTISGESAEEDPGQNASDELDREPLRPPIRVGFARGRGVAA